MYKLIAGKQPVIRLSDGVIIGSDTPEFAEYLVWIAAGNTPTSADPPTAEELAAIADTAAKTVAKTDIVVQYLRNHTPAECEAYVQAQVTDLASARQMMKKFAVVLCVLARQEFRE